MGYTHYFGTSNCSDNKTFQPEIIEKIKNIFKRYENIISLEDSLNLNEKIEFNGLLDKKGEIFRLRPKINQQGFCKTYQYPYDVVVSEILLVMFDYYDNFILSSDGFWITKQQADIFKKTGKIELNGYWNVALKNVKQLYNIDSFKWELNIHKNHYNYYCMRIKH